ncbi:OLC1v1027897C1 [Oldenlandia corymbosa var. corymbosa]|uniref:Endoplasmic reticulum transmembrane protein n=1 Tax=Oldenlandia corymbosa var. corymbosa TaxID=529605 RepID=A0AAV1CCR4_OLDCO|nr:OLC1v1027897C1 [Oldenlandia corymbosa var. corymbosa]
MIQLLFSLIFTEITLIVMFVFKTPLRKLVIMGIDRAKRGRGPIVVKTVAGTVFVVMMTSVYSAMEIQRRLSQDAEISPTDQILMGKHMLEATLMGFSLFLAFMIDKLHHYIRELRIRRKTMETAKKQGQGFEDGNNGGASKNVVKAMEEEVAALQRKIKELEAEVEERSKESRHAEANKLALQKQSEGFLLEYGRLQEENESLRSQLQALDRQLSQSDSKKSM